MPTILDDQLQELLLQMEQFGRENDQRENDRQRKMLNLERDSAVLIHILARAIRCRNILEIGTSNAYSTIWLADAVRQLGRGQVTSIERDPAKMEMACGNLRSAKLLEYVTLLEGEASQLVEVLSGPYDCVFFDGDRISAPKQLQILLPKLSADVVLLCDNVLSHPAEVADYVQAVDHLTDFSSITVPIGKGLHIGYRQESNPHMVQAKSGQESA